MAHTLVHFHSIVLSTLLSCNYYGRIVCFDKVNYDAEPERTKESKQTASFLKFHTYREKV